MTRVDKLLKNTNIEAAERIQRIEDLKDEINQKKARIARSRGSEKRRYAPTPPATPRERARRAAGVAVATARPVRVGRPGTRSRGARPRAAINVPSPGDLVDARRHAWHGPRSAAAPRARAASGAPLLTVGVDQPVGAGAFDRRPVATSTSMPSVLDSEAPICLLLLTLSGEKSPPRRCFCQFC